MDEKTQLDLFGPTLTQANLARMRGQWNEAADLCVRVLRAHPGNADAHSLLGDIYRDQGALDDAIQWYRMAVDLRPDGPDAAKLQKMEQLRERNGTASAALTPAVEAVSHDSVSGGTAQLMGYSPKRWLNTLTIVSVCFLAATLLALVILRTNTPERGAPVARPMQLSSHPVMPTAESGVQLPAINPNRPTVLPVGEHAPPAPAVHHTGDGLAPDRPGSSRTTPLPNFSQPATGSTAAVPATPQTKELLPAPIHIIRPVNTTFTSAPAEGGATNPDNGNTTPAEGAAGQSPERDPSAERAPGQGPETERPAPNDGAGDNSSQNNRNEENRNGNSSGTQTVPER